jgi:hypothetical protein
METACAWSRTPGRIYFTVREQRATLIHLINVKALRQTPLRTSHLISTRIGISLWTKSQFAPSIVRISPSDHAGRAPAASIIVLSSTQRAGPDCSDKQRPGHRSGRTHGGKKCSCRLGGQVVVRSYSILHAVEKLSRAGSRSRRGCRRRQTRSPSISRFLQCDSANGCSESQQPCRACLSEYSYNLIRGRESPRADRTGELLGRFSGRG